MISKSHLLLAVKLLLISSAVAAAQNYPPPRQASDFNVEILNLVASKYVGSVPAGGLHSGLYGNANLRRVTDWQPSAEVPMAAAVLKVEFWLEQDAIRIEVIAYLGEIPPNSRPPDWEKLPQIKIASRLVHVDETMNVEEARRVGIQPFQMKVVRAAPWTVGPPEIVNQTQALHVESTTEERPAYTVTLRNVSAKNIAALQWYGTENDRRGGGGGERAQPWLIHAGQLHQIHAHFANSNEQRGDNSQPELPRRRQIVIAAVLFDDGSFEGESDVALGLALSWQAEVWQVSRIIPLLQTASASAVQDQGAALTKLTADLAALGEEVDSQLINRVLARFPKPAETEQRALTSRFKAGLGFAKNNLLNEIKRFEYERAHRADAKDVRTWCEAVIARYQKYHSPYQ